MYHGMSRLMLHVYRYTPSGGVGYPGICLEYFSSTEFYIDYSGSWDLRTPYLTIPCIIRLDISDTTFQLYIFSINMINIPLF